jgi:hypothetical protein
MDLTGSGFRMSDILCRPLAACAALCCPMPPDWIPLEAWNWRPGAWMPGCWQDWRGLEEVTEVTEVTAGLGEILTRSSFRSLADYLCHLYQRHRYHQPQPNPHHYALNCTHCSEITADGKALFKRFLKKMGQPLGYEACMLKGLWQGLKFQQCVSSSHCSLLPHPSTATMPCRRRPNVLLLMCSPQDLKIAPS